MRASIALAFVLLAACGGGPTREQVQQSQREYDLAVGLWSERNTPGAFEHLMRALELDPENGDAHLFLGQLFFMNRHDNERAEEHYRHALRLASMEHARPALSSEAKNALGVLYIHMERYEDAIALLREAASDLMNRDPALTWTNLGWAYHESGDHEHAIEALGQALAASPHLCIAWYRVGQVRASREQWTEAEEALGHVLDVEDETCLALQVAWRLRGEVRARLGHRDEAVQDFERCLELSAETEDGRACRRLLEASPSPEENPDEGAGDPS
jgi:type IV pilus assembly protein PilF